MEPPRRRRRRRRRRRQTPRPAGRRGAGHHGSEDKAATSDTPAAQWTDSKPRIHRGPRQCRRAAAGHWTPRNNGGRAQFVIGVRRDTGRDGTPRRTGGTRTGRDSTGHGALRDTVQNRWDTDGTRQYETRGATGHRAEQVGHGRDETGTGHGALRDTVQNRWDTDGTRQYGTRGATGHRAEQVGHGRDEAVRDTGRDGTPRRTGGTRTGRDSTGHGALRDTVQNRWDTDGTRQYGTRGATGHRAEQVGHGRDEAVRDTGRYGTPCRTGGTRTGRGSTRHGARRDTAQNRWDTDGTRQYGTRGATGHRAE